MNGKIAAAEMAKLPSPLEANGGPGLTHAGCCLKKLLRGSARGLLTVSLLFACALVSPGAERFDDISVSPQSLASGETYHGYRELRVLLENRSEKDAHRVTLIYPDKSYGFGNSISRISRTVVLGPASRSAVPLWQPPLPASGNNSMRVLVDDREVGSVGVPDPPRHLNRYGPQYGSGGQFLASSLLISRSLNYDEVARTLQSMQPGFGADHAVGPPDAAGRRGPSPAAWRPDASQSGPHWIELDYDQPRRADHVRIYETMGMPPMGEVILKGASGTNLARLPMTSAVSRGGAGSGRREFTFPLTPEPVKTVRIEFGQGYFGSAIAIDAVELEGSGSSVWASSARASSEARANSPMYGGGMTGADTRELLRAELPATEWSEYWLSYTPFDAVVLNHGDLAAMPPPVSSALWRYVESGGNLVLLGGGEVLEPWRSQPRNGIEGGQRYEVGFGQCFIFEGSSAAAMNGAIKTLLSAVNESARRWQTMSDENAANASFPVVENVRIPVRGTVLIMLAFVVLIGPVNLIVLSRMNRRTWLLWTIPAISCFTCLVVFAYSLLREGVTPDVRTEGVTLLDQVNRHATSQALTAFYCPLTPSQGLFFGFDTEAVPLIERADWRSGSRREVDWTEAQHLERGWVSARVPAHFHLRKSEVRRERLQLEAAGKQLFVVNGLGAPVRSLWLADGRGTVYAAFTIGPGQRAALTPLDTAVQEPNPTFRSFFENAHLAPTHEFLATNAVASLSANTYIAELDGNPFIENGLGPKAASSRTKSRAIVYGLLEPSPQP